MPKRVQRRRTKGWRAPEGAVYVGHGTLYDNPWTVIRTNTGTGWAVQWAGHTETFRPLGLKDLVPANNQRDAHALAVELFETWVHGLPTLLKRADRELAGRDLICWCAENLPCHADVWLALVNAERTVP